MGRYSCLAALLVWCLIMGNAVFVSADLQCYCTEPECLNRGRSNMCKKDQNLGCYKEYYSQRDPPITMGCVTSLLLCDQSKMRPKQYDTDRWPQVECCFTDLCNKDLIVPFNSSSGSITRMSTVKFHMSVETSSPSGLSRTSSINIRTEKDANLALEDGSSSPVDPVFLLLIVLVVLFLIVVFASILVIVKIWLYRRKKPKEIQISGKNWKSPIYSDYNHHTHTMYLLASTDSSSSQQTSSSTLLQTFDVP